MHAERRSSPFTFLRASSAISSVVISVARFFDTDFFFGMVTL